MELFSTKKLVESLESGLGDGPLTLEIVCTKCNAHFELNREAVAMAFMMGTTLLDYVKYVQSSKCESCDDLAKKD